MKSRAANLGAPAFLPEPVPANISVRELQVWVLLASGDTVKAIGLALGISPKTCEYHRAQLYRKLGLCDLASLTRAAIRAGLIQP